MSALTLEDLNRMMKKCLEELEADNKKPTEPMLIVPVRTCDAWKKYLEDKQNERKRDHNG